MENFACDGDESGDELRGEREQYLLKWSKNCRLNDVSRVSTSYIYIYIDSTTDVSFWTLLFWKRNIPRCGGRWTYCNFYRWNRSSIVFFPSVWKTLWNLSEERKGKLLGNEIIGKLQNSLHSSRLIEVNDRLKWLKNCICYQTLEFLKTSILHRTSPRIL